MTQPQPLSTPPSQSTSELRVLTEKTEFVVLEDPSRLDTNAVVLTGAVCFRHRSADQVLTDLRLHGVSLLTSWGGFSGDSQAVIVEPTDLEVLIAPPPSSTSMATRFRSRVPSTGLQVCFESVYKYALKACLQGLICTCAIPGTCCTKVQRGCLHVGPTHPLLLHRQSTLFGSSELSTRSGNSRLSCQLHRLHRAIGLVNAKEFGGWLQLWYV